MNYQGIVLTGTRGSGKTTIAKEIKNRCHSITQVAAVTNRKPRSDDEEWHYKYLTEEEFDILRKNGELLIQDEYMGNFYGILQSDFQKIIQQNKIPLLTITPKSAQDLQEQKNETFFSIFIDAPDDILSSRLSQRQSKISIDENIQRLEDRKYSREFLYCIKNIDLNRTVELIINLWEFRNTGGVIPGRLIGLMISCEILLKNADPGKVQGASYDLSLGDEYFYGGRIRTLTDKEPFLLIEPYDYAIVVAHEIADLPRDVSGRFDLTVGLFCQGIILSNGPQVDPGFKGQLFCLLFNTSNSPVVLKRRQHYATVEFHKLLEPTYPYKGRFLDKIGIIHYLPENTMRGAIHELKKEVEQLRAESQKLQSTFLGIISLILAVIAILLASR